METVEITEEYNQDGVVVKRQINGIDVPADEFPSAKILMNAKSITTKKFMTLEEVKKHYPDYPPTK